MSDRLAQLNTFLADSPNDPFLHFAVAKEFEKMGKQAQALDQYLRLKELDPNYVGVYYHLGKLFEKLEAPQKAWDTYTAGMAVAKKTGDTHAHNELAEARLILGDEEDFED